MMNAAAPWQQLRLFIRPVVPSPSAISCEACQDGLPVFITEELMGQPVDQLYPQLAHHLETCHHCLAAYDEIATLVHLDWPQG